VQLNAAPSIGKTEAEVRAVKSLKGTSCFDNITAKP
jgi:hypothetical protein